ncbi:hypothetical protein NCCP2716_06260 [Sporosarcina sp. NCCP-2716]|uniref:DUF342 domain-containing protein n=1 Tax=Sporosarcina sp. NCCP-2716 TaxID=2943679 RepID=UPI002040F20C|nr:FapA family protein [Sporosarcina sp. NCCP-2716]GKV68128.1 hypothetical protein NCCP2716_06260 [Sporosarcina sp. NCCP-2716]
MLFENDFITLTLENDTVSLYTKKGGFPLKSFDQVTQQLPRLRISSFPELRRALSTVETMTEIGTYSPEIVLSVSSGSMKAEAEILLTAEELEEKLEALPGYLDALLDEARITGGRLKVDWDAVRPRQPFLAAKGKEPLKGKDAQTKYIEAPERRPVIREDGSANYYEMNFVTPVKKGDWLGEKIPAEEGTPGMDIYRNEIPGKRGLDVKLFYDRKSVEETEEQGKIVLRAAHGGVLEFQNGVVGVGRQLVIEGDVGPETGSVTFDGTVVISGTVLAGYSVIATGDISVGAKEGVTNAKEIRSEQSDIYIQGGIFGGGSTVLEASGTIFIKHANDCILYAQTIQVGLYLLGSEVAAEHVYVDRLRGRIIGGRTEAMYRIECATAGNQHERNTVLIARGIDKEALQIEIQQLAQSIKDMQQQICTLEVHIEPLEAVASTLAGSQAEAYAKVRKTIHDSQNEIYVLDELIQKKLHIMKTAVRPQIEITKEANAGVTIQVGTKSSVLSSPTKGVFELTDGVLNI